VRASSSQTVREPAKRGAGGVAAVAVVVAFARPSSTFHAAILDGTAMRVGMA
jgi:hypothetical protein